MRENLMKKFDLYQSILCERAMSFGSDGVDLESIVEDYCAIDEECRIGVKYIPVSGEYVYLSVRLGRDKERTEDIRVSTDALSEEKLEEVVELMRKAVIIEELRQSQVLPL